MARKNATASDSRSKGLPRQMLSQGAIVRIRSKRDGFRRCGIAHPSKPTDYPADQFSEEELEALQSEPTLVVQVLEGEAKP